MSRELTAQHRKRRIVGQAFAVIAFVATALAILVLAVLLVDIVRDGAGRLSLEFLSSYPSRFAARSGIKPALYGSVWTLVLTAVVAFPVGVGTAVWLEEYAPNNRFTRLVQTNIANLAGVPSIVYGILGLALFVRFAGLGRSVLAGALTLALLILPIIIIAAQEAIKAVPSTIRLGAYALGATRWEAIRHHVLPLAMPGMLTGAIIGMAQALGETAPLLMIGMRAFIANPPSGISEPATVLPVQIFLWSDEVDRLFVEKTSAAIIVLLVFMLLMNGLAIYLRNRFEQRW